MSSRESFNLDKCFLKKIARSSDWLTSAGNCSRWYLLLDWKKFLCILYFLLKDWSQKEQNQLMSTQRMGAECRLKKRSNVSNLYRLASHEIPLLTPPRPQYYCFSQTSGSLICWITSMITDRFGQHEVLFNHGRYNLYR